MLQIVISYAICLLYGLTGTTLGYIVGYLVGFHEKALARALTSVSEIFSKPFAVKLFGLVFLILVTAPIGIMAANTIQVNDYVNYHVFGTTFPVGESLALLVGVMIAVPLCRWIALKSSY
jgi:hypothetical protein